MATSKLSFYTTAGAAAEIGFSRSAVWGACRDNPGFAVRLGGSYRIPREHVEAVKRGESVAAIAAAVRAGNGAYRAS